MNRKTSLRAVCGLFAVALGGAFAGAAAASTPTPDVKIPFASHGGIRDWEADRDQGLWIQDAHRNWFYAKLMGPCIGLNFAQSIGFDTRPMGTFDRFSAIVVPGEGRCQVQTLRESGAPATKEAPATKAAPSATDQRS
jgi:hypothetical protein